MDELRGLEAMGITLPSPSYLTGVILFSLIGYVAYRYGKRSSLETVKWIGVVLMFYSTFVSETWLLYLVGVMLCIGLYISRR